MLHVHRRLAPGVVEGDEVPETTLRETVCSSALSFECFVGRQEMVFGFREPFGAGEGVDSSTAAT